VKSYPIDGVTGTIGSGTTDSEQQPYAGDDPTAQHFDFGSPRPPEPGGSLFSTSIPGEGGGNRSLLSNAPAIPTQRPDHPLPPAQHFLPPPPRPYDPPTSEQGIAPGMFFTPDLPYHGGGNFEAIRRTPNPGPPLAPSRPEPAEQRDRYTRERAPQVKPGLT